MLQKVQSSTALASTIIKVVGILHTANKNKEIKELKELIIDSFKILSLNMTSNHEIRREKIKRELDPKYQGIGNKEPSTTKLFGFQLQEIIKTMGDSKVNLTMNQTARKRFLGKRRGSEVIPTSLQPKLQLQQQQHQQQQVSVPEPKSEFHKER